MESVTVTSAVTLSDRKLAQPSITICVAVGFVDNIRL